jgi:putative ATPase
LVRHAFYFLGKKLLCLSKTMAQYIRLRNDMTERYLSIMADPQALLVCVAAQQAVHFIGMPEGALALAQAVVHLAAAPKSNALYLAYGAAVEDVKATRNDPVPLHLRNAPTQLMQDLDYGKGYRYAHDDYGGKPDPLDPSRPPPQRLQDYLPPSISDHRYYHPSVQGGEASIQRWLERRRGEVHRSG